MLALVSRCSSHTFEWLSGRSLGRVLPSPPLTLDGRPGRRPLIGSAVCLACNPVASHSGRGAVLLRRASCRAGPLTFGLPSLRLRSPPCGFLRFRVSGRTSPVSRPLRAHERSWRASRHLPVLAAVFRIALRSRPTAPLVTARVPLREAIAVFGPVFRPCPSLGRSPGSAPGPALLQGRWARLRSSLRVFSRTGFRWLSVTISLNLVCVERVIRFSGEKFHRFKTGCGIVAPR